MAIGGGFRDAEYRLLSAPHRMLWAGWESTTSQLQQMGWEFSAEQEFYRYAVRLAFRHQEYKVRGISEWIGAHHVMAIDQHVARYGGPALTFQCHVASDLIMTAPLDLRAFTAIDAMPQMQTITRENMRTIEDALGIFAKPLVRSTEIIVDPKSVQEAMDMLLKVQNKELTEIRQREKQREAREQLHAPRQVFHAQIISLAA